jgi:SAM-dependent methyltransferase
MVLHHVAALPTVLSDVHRLLRPDGVIAVVEFGDRSGLLPDGFAVGREGFAARLATVARSAIEAHLPPGALAIDWEQRLGDAGFELLEHRRLVLHLPAPLDTRTRHWILHGLETSSRVAGGQLETDDAETLSALVDVDDPRCILHRDDLALDLSRTFLLARRC